MARVIKPVSRAKAPPPKQQPAARQPQKPPQQRPQQQRPQPQQTRPQPQQRNITQEPELEQQEEAQHEQAEAQRHVAPQQRQQGSPAVRGTNGTGTAVAAVKVNASMLVADSGAGLENVGREDMAIPFFVILQQLSPQCDQSRTEYIDGAEAGMIMNTATGDCYPGDSGIVVSPVAYQRRYVEWVPRNKGGGFVADHGNDPSVLEGTTRNDNGKDVNADGNEIVLTAMHYVKVCTDEENGVWIDGVIAMVSTQLKKSRRWNTQMANLQIDHPNGQGTFNPATFYGAYRMTTEPENNEKGSWFGWAIAYERPVLEIPGGEQAYLQARSFKSRVAEGQVQVDMAASARHVDSSAAGADVPF